MHAKHRRPAPRRAGLTRTELIIVVSLLGGFLALLLPSVRISRDSAREYACKDNLRQLGRAMWGFLESHNRLPGRASSEALGGWSTELLPFLGEDALAEELARHGPADTAAVPAQNLARPAVFTCPAARDRASAIAGVQVGHYVLVPDAIDGWRIGDAPSDSRLAWLAGPEMPDHFEAQTVGPHKGGFNFIEPSGMIWYIYK